MDERDKIKNFASKDKLEQYLIQGKGIEEFKQQEKSLFLGEFRERVIKALTIPQLHEEGTYPEIEEAIKDPRAKKLVINRKADLKKAAEYIRLAKEYNLKFTTVDSENIQNQIGLVVASDQGLDIEDIYVKDRSEKLRELGLPQGIIDNPKGKVCKKCYNEIKRLAPEELKNYRLLSFFDRLLGEKCIGCSKSNG